MNEKEALQAIGKSSLSSRFNLKSGAELLRTQGGRDRSSLPIGLPLLDRLQEESHGRLALIELTGARSSGCFAVALAALAAATKAGGAAALVDLGDYFDSQMAESAGVDLTRLLWARPRRLKEAPSCAEMILSTGFSLVALDLGESGAASLPAAVWTRLSRGAQAQKGILLLISRVPLGGWAADAVITADRSRPIWLGSGTTPKLLAGLSVRLTLRLRRGRRREFSETLFLPMDRRIGYEDVKNTDRFSFCPSIPPGRLAAAGAGFGQSAGGDLRC